MKDKMVRDEVNQIKASKDEWRDVLASVRLDIEQLAEERDDALRQVVAMRQENNEWQKKLALLMTSANQMALLNFVEGLVQRG